MLGTPRCSGVSSTMTFFSCRHFYTECIHVCCTAQHLLSACYHSDITEFGVFFGFGCGVWQGQPFAQLDGGKWGGGRGGGELASDPFRSITPWWISSSLSLYALQRLGELVHVELTRTRETKAKKTGSLLLMSLCQARKKQTPWSQWAIGIQVSFHCQCCH